MILHNLLDEGPGHRLDHRLHHWQSPIGDGLRLVASDSFVGSTASSYFSRGSIEHAGGAQGLDVLDRPVFSAYRRPVERINVQVAISVTSMAAIRFIPHRTSLLLVEVESGAASWSKHGLRRELRLS